MAMSAGVPGPTDGRRPGKLLRVCQPVVARVRPDIRPKPGDTVELRFNLARSHLFDATSGKALDRAAH